MIQHIANHLREHNIPIELIEVAGLGERIFFSDIDLVLACNGKEIICDSLVYGWIATFDINDPNSLDNLAKLAQNWPMALRQP